MKDPSIVAMKDPIHLVVSWAGEVLGAGGEAVAGGSGKV